ncbi:YcjF family protein [Niveispirillum sp. KHB5.9]|uniref:YcjF family protein n=1 Tax=Niveispirillum sp. KHB5.9 TaxID=3400269 RepID=UPI003A883BD0
MVTKKDQTETAVDPVVTTDPATAQAFAEADAAAAADNSDLDAARAAHAATIIRNHVLAGAATVVVPVVLLDSAALAGVQLNLVRELAKVYGQDFRADLVRPAVATLFATIAPKAVASTGLSALVASIPVIGTAYRWVALPGFNAAFTYAVGKVFQQHFASGGTFLTFDPEKVKEYFVNQYNKVRGKKAAEPAAAAA